MRNAILILGLLLLAACAQQEPVTLTILSTNDIHGGIEQTSKDRDTDRPIGGAANLAALVRKEREANPDGTLLLDGGDIYQGTALSNLTEGRATIDVMNATGYDAAVLGNHEFDWGIDLMVQRIEQANFPMLCANVFQKSDGARPDWATPYTIVERQGLKILLIGLITPSTPRVTLPQNVAHLDFGDPADIANEIIADLVPSKADVAILVCHIGGFSNRDGSITGNFVDLAREVDGEIAVIGGHTHRQVAGVVDGTVLLEAGSSMRWLGKAKVVIDPNTRTVQSATASILTVFADELTPDQEVATLVHAARVEVAPVMERVIGQAGVELWTRRSESPMGNLIADVLRDEAKVDLAFQNPGGVRASIDPGPIKYEDVYRVMPFDNTIVTLELSGAEVRTLLEEAVGDGSFLHAAGLKYTADYGKPSGQRIVSLVLNDGSRLTDDGLYDVAINNFMAQGGDSLPTVTNRDHAHDTGVLVREAMATWIEARREVVAQVEDRAVFLNR